MQSTSSCFIKDRPVAPGGLVTCGPFLAWPGWPFLRFAWLLSIADGVWFAFVYGGCNWITAHRQFRVPIHLPIELSVPLVPSAVLLYMSIYLLFLAGPFIVRNRREFAATIRALALAIFVGGIGFLLLPARAAFPPPGDVGAWTGLLRSARTLALEYNMVPSLHVALSVCCVAVFVRHTPAAFGRVLLWSWAAAIALSTLLTHQHHVIDAVTGWLLGLAVSRSVPEGPAADSKLLAASEKLAKVRALR